MTSTLSRTRSTARSGNLSDRPSADRYSTMMFWPSTHPSARSPCPNASEGVRLRKEGEHVWGGPSRRLRLKSERRGQEAAAKIGNERATGDQWITSSARASTDGGTASPNVFAVSRG